MGAYYKGQRYGSSTVKIQDTGANGLYKAMLEGTALSRIVRDEGITQLAATGYRLCPIDIRNVEVLSLPNLVSVGTNSLFMVDNALRVLEFSPLLNITTIPNANFGQGFIKLISTPNKLKVLGVNTLGSYSGMCFLHIKHLWLRDVKNITDNCIYSGDGFRGKTITCDSLASLSGHINFGSSANSTFIAFIILSKEKCQLTRTFDRTSDITTGFTKFYVPKVIVEDYKSATNWNVYANQFFGIDEQVSVANDDTFTPAYAGQDVVTWDMVDLQEETVATIDSLTGTVSTTDNGRILVRGLDQNDDIKYVAYLIIGNGGFND